MKQCDLCNKIDVIHYRVKSINYKIGFFAVYIVGILFQEKDNILMEEPENQRVRANIKLWLNLIG